MGKLIITTFLSLDGVTDEPQNWSLNYWNDEIMAFKEQENRESSALLLGRKTYEGFAQAWPSRSGDYADRFNALPKYVVSTTLKDPAWNNSQVIQAKALVEQLLALKSKHEGDIAVHGSRTLAQWLVLKGLADELRLLVYPIILGNGHRLFEGLEELKLELADVRRFATGAALSIYHPI